MQKTILSPTSNHLSVIYTKPSLLQWKDWSEYLSLYPDTKSPIMYFIKLKMVSALTITLTSVHQQCPIYYQQDSIPLYFVTTFYMSALQ